MKDVIMVNITGDGSLTTTILVDKIIRLQPSGSSWTDILLVDNSKVSAFHTVEHLIQIMDAKA